MTQCLNSGTSYQTKSLFLLQKAELQLRNFQNGTGPAVETTHGMSAEFEQTSSSLAETPRPGFELGLPPESKVDQVRPRPARFPFPLL